MYKRVTLLLQFDISNTFYLYLLKTINNIPIPISILPKITSTKMIFPHVTPMSLLAASTLFYQALSIPLWSSDSDTHMAKRASGVAYAGVNIAGCDFGIDTTVSQSTLHWK